MTESYVALFQLAGMILSLLLVGWMIFYSGKYFLKLIRDKKFSLHPLLKGFKQKMWMTIGLGSLFFSFYFLIVLLSAYLIDSQSSLNLFFLFYAHPTEFIYLGLFIFACMSLCIYLVRMFIKYFYMTRSKE
ncbi:hypothetical protein [Candidatus Protochlamydia phocaeensis]|uniref:hypothetical protein n=1 Tax=Candidatus Protochlamydia phocaeensis TaxID=1414722 RepID=UPI000837C9B9|nr:hypothetical protein [Candidatus Protochlamydia phocaeensis]